MTDFVRVLVFCISAILNYILINSGIWHLMPDIFICIVISYAALSPVKLPSINYFVLFGFLVDILFLNSTMPYILTFLLMGLYFNFSQRWWIQLSLLEQILLIFLISVILNSLVFFFHSSSEMVYIRLLLNPILNSLVWVLIFILYRKAWLKNIWFGLWDFFYISLLYF